MYISEKSGGSKIRKKTYMIPGVNIISGKLSVADVRGAGCTLSPSAGDLVSGAP